jgi:UDP-glucose 4-epimerase
VRVLVTGGAGFIGSHVVDRMLAAGHDVSVADDFSSGSRDNLAHSAAAEVHEIDVRSPDLEKVFVERRPEVVLHLAAQIDVRVSVRDPVLDADVNILGTLNVLENARKHGARKVVVTSSGGCVYGEGRRLPLKETDRGRPRSPYGISKRVLHDYLAFYEASHGLAYAVLALGNVCGPRQDPHGEAGVVALFLGAMLEGRPTTIFGDGSQTRDFVYVGDVADAYERALTKGRGIYNVGTGVETSVRELWAACAELTGYAQEPVLAPERPGELRRNALDAGRAKRDLGWAAVTSLRDALRQTASALRR